MIQAKEYKEYIESHMLESKESALKTTMTIQNSELNAGGPNYTRTLQIPKFFTQEDKQNFNEIVQMTYGIFTKVIHAYRKDEKVRSLFGFSKELEELIVLKPRYASMIPICRVDIFYNEQTKDFHFCEFNTDGTSAMNENKRLHEFLKWNNVYTHFQEDYEEMELVESWADTFLDICASDQKLPKDFRIGIVDFLDKAYLSELYVFEKVFQARNIPCEVIDIRKLEYREGKLYSKVTNQPIDVIYRRAVTRDIMEQYDQVSDFIQAVKDDAVCLIGAFQTQLVHHKEISKVLVSSIMQAYFNQEEIEFIEKHLPATYDLDESIKTKVLENKDQWIVKPKDSYASKGVWAGVDLSDDRWQEVVEHSMNQDYIVQTYITPYQTENIDLVNYDTFQQYSNLTGLYVYDGKFAGVYSRLSDSGIISTQYNEKTIPTLFIK